MVLGEGRGGGVLERGDVYRAVGGRLLQGVEEGVAQSLRQCTCLGAALARYSCAWSSQWAASTVALKHVLHSRR